MGGGCSLPRSVIILTAHLFCRYEAKLHALQQSLTGTLVRTSPKRTLYVRALFDYDPNKVSNGKNIIVYRIPVQVFFFLSASASLILRLFPTRSVFKIRIFCFSKVKSDKAVSVLLSVLRIRVLIGCLLSFAPGPWVFFQILFRFLF
jgi:hypothetical protein